MSTIYNVGSLVDTIIKRSKDNTISRTDVIDYIDETQSDALGRRKLIFQEASKTTTLSAGDKGASLPVGHQSTTAIFLKDNATTVSEPIYIPNNKFYLTFSDNNLTTGCPEFYTITGSNIVFECTLDKTYDLVINYIVAPTRLEGESDVPLIPVEFRAILINGGRALVEEQRENFDIAAVYRRRAEDQITDMATRYSLRDTTKRRKAFRNVTS